jgi:hypothetical protein
MRCRRVRDAFIKHMQAIESYRDAGAWRQAGFQCCDEFVVYRTARSPESLPLTLVRLESFHLFIGVKEFHVAISEFERPGKYLESVGNRCIIGADSGQCSLARRVVMQYGQSIGRKLRRYFFSENQVQPFIELITKRRSEIIVSVEQVRQCPGVRRRIIKPGEFRKRLNVAEKYRRLLDVFLIQDTADEIYCFLHDFFQGEIQPIPFDHREFSLMMSATFATPKHFADFVDIRVPGAEESLHAVLGRRLQVPR